MQQHRLPSIFVQACELLVWAPLLAGFVTSLSSFKYSLNSTGAEACGPSESWLRLTAQETDSLVRQLMPSH